MLKVRFYKHVIAVLALCCICNVNCIAQTLPNSIKIDFAYAGYNAGIQKQTLQIPTVLFVKPTGKDDSQLLQGTLIEIGSEQISVTSNPIKLEADVQVGSLEPELKTIDKFQVDDPVFIQKPITKAG